MNLQEQIAIAVQSEARRKGATTGTCAGLYAVAIGLASGTAADYWRPINEALEASFGPKGRERAKETAWKIHEHVVEAMRKELQK